MWYLHNHFVCARLLALCAIAAPSFLAISDLNNRYARRKDLICKAKVFSTRIAGGFMFRTLLVLNKAKALKKYGAGYAPYQERPVADSYLRVTSGLSLVTIAEATISACKYVVRSSARSSKAF